MTEDDTDEMVMLSQIPILDGEEWSLSEAIDSDFGPSNNNVRLSNDS